MTFEDHVSFAAACYRHYPVQRHYNSKACLEFLASLDACVLELGGWTGDLGIEACEAGLVVGWTNYDLLPVSRRDTLPAEFEEAQLRDYIWNLDLNFNPYDTFVATHVIEHLSWEHLKLLLDWIKRTGFRNVLLEAPIKESGTGITWDGYLGSHILEVGWSEIESYFGATKVYQNGDVRGYKL